MRKSCIPEAFYNLGCHYFSGGYIFDSNKAIEWLLKASEYQINNKEAYNALGVIYDHRKDYSMAYKMFRKAYQKGSKNCYYNLGYYYYHGFGVERNIPEAIKYLRKAISYGNQDAIKLLDIIESSGYQDNGSSASL